MRIQDRKTVIRLVRNKQELRDVFAIREAVFMREQHVSAALEWDGLDDTTKHVILFFRRKPVGCARIRFVHKKIKLERIAILKGYRGLGLGRKIMNYLLRYCARRPEREIILHAQVAVVPFYEKFGFRRRGKEFLDARIPHVEMYRLKKKY